MTDKQTRPELEYERDWCRAKIKELQAKYEHAYNALLAEQKENAALVEAASGLLPYLHEVLSAHSDPEDPNYNECETPESECMWCADVKQIIDALAALIGGDGDG